MMGVDLFYVVYSVRKWIVEEDGLALMEAAMLFPPMITLLMGVYDLGNGIVVSQKTITSSQIAADLVSRNRTMNTTNLNDIIEGAKLAFEPYHMVNFGIDVVSIEFDAEKHPDILWRRTENMPPNDTAVNSVDGFAEQGEGMIIVTVQYTYIPRFAKFFTGNMDFSEVAFTRGRRSSTVTWD
jgi:Flp pilus assembly protein TadG